MPISRRTLIRTVLLCTAVSIVLLFQNCGGGFKVQTEFNQELLASLAVPTITFVDSPELINTPLHNIQFNIFGISTNYIKSVYCQLNTNPQQDCANKSVVLNNLVDGDYSLKVMVETTAGVKVDAIKVFRKDGTAPVITVAAKPPVMTNQITAQFVFTVVDNLSGVEKTECALDAGAFAACASPVNLTALAVGNHTYKIKSSDKAGNASAETAIAWTIDLTVPTVVISQTPLAVTNSTSANFVFQGAGIVKYECTIDAAAFAPCTSPQAYANLAAGNHTFKVHGTNGAGSVSADAMYSWMIDNVAPTVPVLTSNVLAQTRSTSANISFSATDAGSGVASYECSLDVAAFAKCFSAVALTSLASGNHQFKVRALDNAGNVSAVGTFAWTIDLSPPVITFTSVPAKITTNAPSNFTFTVTDNQSVASVQCSWATGGEISPLTDCKSGVANYNLPASGYVLTVQAVDNLGNASSVNYGWDVDDGVGTIAKYKDVAIGFLKSCGITANDTVKCWGLGEYSGSSLPIDIPGTAGTTSITSGTSHVCALLSNGHVYCWGSRNPEFGLNGDIGLTGILQASAGGYATCALMPGGSVKCWGYNYAGQLGNNTVTTSITPVDVIGITGAKFISSGELTSCVITAQDSVKCWGGYLVDNNNPTLTPIDIPKLTDIKFLDVGGESACAIDSQNKMTCFKGATVLPIPPEVQTVKSVSGSNSNFCALTLDNRVFCWGDNQYGNLGLQDPNAKAGFVPGLENIKRVIVGESAACAITSQDTTKCWGRDYYGMLGHNATSESFAPVPYKYLSDVKKMVSDQTRTCALLNSGTVKCWGEGNYGEGAQGASFVPADVAGLASIKDLAMGQGYTCAHTAQDIVKCWGYDSVTFAKSPVDLGLTGVKQISAGVWHGCAVLNSGNVKCWGYNGGGYLGDGTTKYSAVPVDVLNISNAVAIISTIYATCVTLNTGANKCWGDGFTKTAEDVPHLLGVKLLSSEFSFMYGLAPDNSIAIFSNGTNHGTISNIPGATTVSSGYFHSCAITNTGVVKCWGYNDFGQLGNNNTTYGYLETANTGNPATAVFIGTNATYFSYADKSIGMVGLKYSFLRAPSGILKAQ